VIRKARIGRGAEANCLALTDAILACINDYIRHRPEATLTMILTALEDARDAVANAQLLTAAQRRSNFLTPKIRVWRHRTSPLVAGASGGGFERCN
jgi:hypothetical protein